MISSCGDHFYRGDQSSNEETGESVCVAPTAGGQIGSLENWELGLS